MTLAQLLCAVQLWIKKSMKEMGFNPRLSDKAPKESKIPISTGFPAPLFDVADFAELIKWERWDKVPAEERPKACIYFCQALNTPRTPVSFKKHSYPEREKRARTFGQNRPSQDHFSVCPDFEFFCSSSHHRCCSPIGRRIRFIPQQYSSLPNVWLRFQFS